MPKNSVPTFAWHFQPLPILLLLCIAISIQALEQQQQSQQQLSTLGDKLMTSGRKSANAINGDDTNVVHIEEVLGKDGANGIAGQKTAVIESTNNDSNSEVRVEKKANGTVLVEEKIDDGNGNGKNNVEVNHEREGTEKSQSVEALGAEDNKIVIYSPLSLSPLFFISFIIAFIISIFCSID